jgi:hypothetical protein
MYSKRDVAEIFFGFYQIFNLLGVIINLESCSAVLNLDRQRSIISVYNLHRLISDTFIVLTSE